MPNTFKCDKCGGEFPMGDDEEVDKEMVENYGRKLKQEERSIICDTCYETYMDWYERDGRREWQRSEAERN